jgi:hypothetical protein
MTSIYPSLENILAASAPGVVVYLIGVLVWLLTVGMLSVASLPIMLLGACFIIFGTLTKSVLSKREKGISVSLYLVVIGLMFWGMYF